MMTQEAHRCPVIAFHIASQCVQRVARGFLLRLTIGQSAASGTSARVPKACRRTAAAVTAFKGAATAKGGGAAGRDVSAANARVQNTELTLVARYMEAKVRRGTSAVGGEELQFNDWILVRLQAFARMVPWRAYQRGLRLKALNAAAVSIQRARRSRGLVPSGAIPGRKKRRGPPSSGRAAFLIQRAWRGFTNRRIFGYLRQMLLFREQGDAKELLRCINPREACLIDPATAIHVRFRLGGQLFPPAIYYKVYTHAPVTDIGAFAPRDYTAHAQPPPIALHNHGKEELLAHSLAHDGWYRRSENNGWRPVAGEALADMDTTARTSRPIVWHHDKLVRKEAALRKRKERKRQWLREMYALGKGGSGAEGAAPLPGGAGLPLAPDGAQRHGDRGDEFDDGEGEEDLDALLQWSDGLDFDAYQQDWLALATSSRPEYPSMATMGQASATGADAQYPR